MWRKPSSKRIVGRIQQWASFYVVFQDEVPLGRKLLVHLPSRQAIQFGGWPLWWPPRWVFGWVQSLRRVLVI